MKMKTLSWQDPYDMGNLLSLQGTGLSTSHTSSARHLTTATLVRLAPFTDREMGASARRAIQSRALIWIQVCQTPEFPQGKIRNTPLVLHKCVEWTFEVGLYFLTNRMQSRFSVMIFANRQSYHIFRKPNTSIEQCQQHSGLPSCGKQRWNTCPRLYCRL